MFGVGRSLVSRQNVLLSRQISPSILSKNLSTGLIKPYPSNSRDPVIAKAQGEIFGIMDSYDNFPSGQKVCRGPGNEEALRNYYPETESSKARRIRKECDREIKKYEEQGGREKEIAELKVVRAEFGYTDKQKYRLIRLARLKERGKVPTKKFQGKRSMKKK